MHALPSRSPDLIEWANAVSLWAARTHPEAIKIALLIKGLEKH